MHFPPIDHGADRAITLAQVIAQDDASDASPNIRSFKGLPIRHKLLLSFCAAATALVCLMLFSIGQFFETTKDAAVLEATHVARAVGDASAQIGVKNVARLQAYVDHLHAGYDRDIVIVDVNKRGLADANPAEQGDTYDHDGSNEVGLTLLDGNPRTFVEKNALHPAGAQQIVVPIYEAGEASNRIIGGVVMEYTPLWDELLTKGRIHLALTALTGLLLIAALFVVSSSIYTQISGPVQRLQLAVTRLMEGAREVEVPGSADDELGLLTRSFNEMARTIQEKEAALQRHHAELEQAVSDRTADLRVVNTALRAEVAENARAALRNEHLANFDVLTGLPNRAMFSGHLQRQIALAKTRSSKLALLFVDLDRFKVINDTLGHEAGDDLLKEVASRLRTCVRKGDLVARLGGDEFVVVMAEPCKPENIEGVAKSILRAVSKPFRAHNLDFSVTASIGVSVYPEHGAQERSLMKNADIAMYRAKEEGKNTYQLFTPEIDSHSLQRLALEASLRRAVEGNQFELHYQPKVSSVTGEIVGTEALLRWNHPDLGMVEPANFIPLAEETGLITDIGRWVLKAACLQNAQWQQLGEEISVAVNISARQFSDAGVVSDIQDALAVSGLPAHLLEIEITESTLIKDIGRAAKILAHLRDLGVRIALDDFGTGYSSLANLKRFQIDTIKIDRSFVRELPDNAGDRGIAQAILAMGHAHGLTVVAEGVENSAQAAFLRHENCDLLQGYMFGRPVSALLCTELLGSPQAKASFAIVDWA